MTALPETLQPTLPARDKGAVLRPEERQRLYVWQVPVRVTHWVTAGCIVVLSITGVYIADPFLVPPGGQIMGDIRLVHMIAAFTLLVSGMLRVLWLILGNRFSRWSAFFPTSWNQFTELFRQAAFYASLTKHHPKVLGHNQLAASAYVVLWALLLAETITGFALDGLIGAEPGSTAFWWVREIFGPQNLRLIHHFFMWAIIAIALFHVYSCVLIDHIESNGLMSSIFSGYKFVTAEEVVESRDGGPELLGELEPLPGTVEAGVAEVGGAAAIAEAEPTLETAAAAAGAIPAAHSVPGQGESRPQWPVLPPPGETDGGERGGGT
jgi:Ni/Fe-hydrogenase 1 B-type cytochrome subunit